MSKRYGRNQKRHHIQQINQLRQEVEREQIMARSIALSMRANLNKAKDTITQMVRMIKSACGNSIALPPTRVQGNDNDLLNPFRLDIPQDTMDSIFCRMQHVDLYALNVYLREHLEQFTLSVHLDYAAGPHSAYMISEEGLKSMPTDELANRFAPAIAHQLANHLKGQL